MLMKQAAISVYIGHVNCAFQSRWIICISCNSRPNVASP